MRESPPRLQVQGHPGGVHAVELMGMATNAAVAILVALIGGWFGKRIIQLEGKNTTLENRIDELEEEQHYQWGRERQLIDFIYRQGLVPPEPLERKNL